MDAGRELQRVEKTINKIIQLQNKVKIRYVNNCQLMEYLYLKYNTDSAAKLEKQWKMYQDEKEERKQFAEAEAKIEDILIIVKEKQFQFLFIQCLKIVVVNRNQLFSVKLILPWE